MKLNESPLPSEGQLDKFEESIRIINHVKQHIRTSGVMVYLAPHEPLETEHHDDSEYKKIANNTVRRHVREANQKSYGKGS